MVKLEYEEVDNDDTLIMEPEKATNIMELMTDESFEKEIDSQIQNEWEVKDKEKYDNMDNDLTRSKNMEIQNWVLKFDSSKKVHVSSKTSKEDLPKTNETPLSKPKPNPTDNVPKLKTPPSIDCKWRNPPWKMKETLINPTKHQDKEIPPQSLKLIE